MVGKDSTKETKTVEAVELTEEKSETKVEGTTKKPFDKKGVLLKVAWLVVGILLGFFATVVITGTALPLPGSLGYVKGPGGVRIITQNDMFAPVETDGRVAEVAFSEATRIVIEMEMANAGIKRPDDKERLAFIKKNYGEEMTIDQAVEAMGVDPAKGNSVVDFLIMFESFKEQKVGKAPVAPEDPSEEDSASVDASETAAAREQYTTEAAAYNKELNDLMMGVFEKYQLHLFKMN